MVARCALPRVLARVSVGSVEAASLATSDPRLCPDCTLVTHPLSCGGQPASSLYRKLAALHGG